MEHAVGVQETHGVMMESDVMKDRATVQNAQRQGKSVQNVLLDLN